MCVDTYPSIYEIIICVCGCVCVGGGVCVCVCVCTMCVILSIFIKGCVNVPDRILCHWVNLTADQDYPCKGGWWFHRIILVKAVGGFTEFV